MMNSRNSTGSLLFNLAPYTKIPQEDIATLSLRSIIEESPALRIAFTKLLCDHLYIPLDENVCHYKTQVTGNKLERPDIVGFDKNEKEVLICEAKFYAALTENQPRTYLERLRERNGKGLVFLCPKNRINGLWKQLSEVHGAESVKNGEYCVSVRGIRMGIVSWEELLNTLETVSQRNDAEMMVDLQELDVFCKRIIDNKIFRPFSEADFGADVAISIERYYEVMDELRDRLLSNNVYGITQQGEKRPLHSEPQRGGDYYIYMRANECCPCIYFDKYAWQEPNSVYTPFWLVINSLNWKQNEDVKAYIHSLPEELVERNKRGELLIALEPPIGLSIDETSKELCNQVLSYIDGYIKSINK